MTNWLPQDGAAQLRFAFEAEMKAARTDRQAAFARAKRSLARQQLVIRLHRWNGPGRQDRIGKIGNAIGFTPLPLGTSHGPCQK